MIKYERRNEKLVDTQLINFTPNRDENLRQFLFD